jgi:protein arginine kinase activator
LAAGATGLSIEEARVFADESPDWNLDLNGSADCELCGEEPATMHLLKVVDGSIIHTHLCARCAEEMAAEQTEGLALVLAVPSVLRGFPKQASAEDREATGGSAVNHGESFCGVCGTTLSDVKESGMVGCANCYRVFADHLEATVRREAEPVEHLGKVPLRGPETDTLRHEMMRLERMLRELVQHERYEEAAGVRDRLSELGQRLDGGGA